MRYGKVEAGFWHNPKVKRLSDDGKLLLLYLYSCPHGNSVGCFVLPAGYILADLGWSSERVAEHVSELVTKGFIDRDETTDLTRLRGWFGHNTIENENVAKAAIKTVSGLPRCQTLFNLINALNELGNRFIDKYGNGLPNPLPNEYRNQEPSLAYPEPSLADGLPNPSTEPVPKPDAAAVDKSRLQEVGEKVVDLCGNPPTPLHYGRVRVWLEQGADPELDIYPAVRKGLLSLNGRPVRNLSYFDGIVADAMATRTKPMPEGHANGRTPEPERLSIAEQRRRNPPVYPGKRA